MINNNPVMVGNIGRGEEPFIPFVPNEEVYYTETTVEPTFFKKYGLWVAIIGGGLIAYFIFRK